MAEEEKTPKFRIGEILVNHGYITGEDLEKALAVQQESSKYKPLGQICVDLGYISGFELSKVLRKYRKHMYLGELLVNMGLITGDQLEKVLEIQKQKKKRLGQLLIESGYLTENQLIKSLSMQLGIPIINPDLPLIDQKLALRFSEPFLRRQEAVPIFDREGVVTLIMADPLSDDIINDFKKTFNQEIEPAITSRSAIHHLLDVLFNKIEYGQKEIDPGLGKDLVIGNVSNEKDAKDDTVNIVNYLVSSAITEGASDIHIEPQCYNLRIRYRIDGVLQHKTDLPKQMAPAITSRIKVMCGMNIAEHRKHQDGRIEARVLDTDVDLRVNVYSSVYGENVVIRVLKRKTTLIDIDKLGFSPAHMARYTKLLTSPTGIILVCGPTGSGKTTTLYASLNYLNKMDKKIITVEDPVEYTMEGVVQGQLNLKAGMTYTDFIAAMMRQDPDVIMIGEIRDNIAAEATIQAALTGHKAFSTFHTEDTTGALLRLMDMGIETFLISSTVVSVVAQRLVRRVCERCKEPYEPDPSIFASFGIKNVDLSKYNFHRGRGCDFCHQTGFRGRIGIHEILLVNDDIRDAILNRRISSEIRRIARSSAELITMREDGFYKACQGLTTLEEILRIVFYNDSDFFNPRDAEEVIRQIEMKEVKISLEEVKPKATTVPSMNISLHVSQKESVDLTEGEKHLSIEFAQAIDDRQQSIPVSCLEASSAQKEDSLEAQPICNQVMIASSDVQTEEPTIKPVAETTIMAGHYQAVKISSTQSVEGQAEAMTAEFNQQVEQPEPKIPVMHGELYRVRFEADTIIQEQDRIQDLFQKYRSLKNECKEDEISEDLLPEFIDFITYYTDFAQKKYEAVFVEFFLKVIEGRLKIFLQFQACKSQQPSYIQKPRGERLLEYLA